MKTCQWYRTVFSTVPIQLWGLTTIRRYESTVTTWCKSLICARSSIVFSWFHILLPTLQKRALGEGTKNKQMMQQLVNTMKKCAFNIKLLHRLCNFDLYFLCVFKSPYRCLPSGLTLRKHYYITQKHDAITQCYAVASSYTHYIYEHPSTERCIWPFAICSHSL